MPTLTHAFLRLVLGFCYNLATVILRSKDLLPDVRSKPPSNKVHKWRYIDVKGVIILTPPNPKDSLVLNQH